jgi:hypothetical protein
VYAISTIAESAGESLVSESEADEARLNELGSSLPLQVLHTRIAIRVPRFQTVDPATLDRLLSREVGLALYYSDALRLSTPTTQFRGASQPC